MTWWKWKVQEKALYMWRRLSSRYVDTYESLIQSIPTVPPRSDSAVSTIPIFSSSYHLQLSRWLLWIDWIICSDAVQIVLLSLQCPSPDTSMNSDWYWSIVHLSLHTPNVIPITLYAFVLLSSTSLPGNGKSNIKNWKPNPRTTGDLLITFTWEWLSLFLETIGWDQITDAYIAYCYIHLKSMNLIKHLSTSHRTASLNIFMTFSPSPLIKKYQIFQPFINLSSSGNSRMITLVYPVWFILYIVPSIHLPYRISNQSYYHRQMNISDVVPDRISTFTCSQYSSEHGNKSRLVSDLPIVSLVIDVTLCTFELTRWWYYNSFLGKLEAQLKNRVVHWESLDNERWEVILI